MLDSEIMKTLVRKRLSASRWLAAGALAALLLTGCARMGPDPEVDNKEVEATLRAYLPELAEAYATGNVEGLKSLTVPKEIARIRHQADQLSDQGKVYVPEFKEVTIEKVTIFQHANAAVTTLEVWDVRSYALGSRTLANRIALPATRSSTRLR